MIRVELPGGAAAFSTRKGGVSEGPFESLNLGLKTDDSASNVEENWRIAAAQLGFPLDRIARIWQVHRSAVVERTARNAAARPDADGQLTVEREQVLSVIVADCLPVALIAPGRAAMLHCGWRPLAGGIVEKALSMFGEPPAAAIGPGIGRCCYEVGEEVLAEFSDLDGVVRGRMLDLRMVVRRKLEACGVSRVEDIDLCTSCRPDLFFSHRRDGGLTGRQGGFAWLS